MKSYKRILLFVLTAAVIFSGCKKKNLNDIELTPLAALTIANVMSGGKVVRLNSNLADSCLVNGFMIFTVKAGASTQIRAYASSRPNTPYYNQSPNTESGGIYSLYLTGTEAAPEAVFVRDDIPPYPSADVVNVRIANLSPNAGPLNVSLASAPGNNIFTNIAYKQVGNFITLPLPMTVPAGTNVFEIRDASNVILFTYTLPDDGTVSISQSRHRNVTLAVKGRVGGSGADALGVLAIPHYKN